MFIFLQECDSSRKHQWTINDNLQCNDKNIRTKNDRCVNGICRGTPYDCLSCETHDGSGCPLQPGYCVIHHDGQRTCFAENQYKPGNPCQVGMKTVVGMIYIDYFIKRTTYGFLFTPVGKLRKTNE